MLVQSFDRFYVVTKFMLPTKGDLKFSNILMILVHTQTINLPKTLNQGNICLN